MIIENPFRQLLDLVEKHKLAPDEAYATVAFRESAYAASQGRKLEPLPSFEGFLRCLRNRRLRDERLKKVRLIRITHINPGAIRRELCIRQCAFRFRDRYFWKGTLRNPVVHFEFELSKEAYTELSKVFATCKQH